MRRKMVALLPPAMEHDERFDRVRALLRQLQSRLPRLSDASLAANATLDHALELIRVYERAWLVQHPVDVRISYWRRRAQGEEMIAAMESAALQFTDEPE
jgi:hypothetical protein